VYGVDTQQGGPRLNLAYLIRGTLPPSCRALVCPAQASWQLNLESESSHGRVAEANDRASTSNRRPTVARPLIRPVAQPPWLKPPRPQRPLARLGQGVARRGADAQHARHIDVPPRPRLPRRVPVGVFAPGTAGPACRLRPEALQARDGAPQAALRGEWAADAETDEKAPGRCGWCRW
jgi:hypothetical protein